MSVGHFGAAARRCVPTPDTQLPLQGAHTPTIAPVDPVAAIAKSTAAFSCWVVSSGKRASDCGGQIELDVLIGGAPDERDHEPQGDEHRDSGAPSSEPCSHFTPR